MRIGLVTPAARSRAASWKSSTAKPSAASSARAARSTPWPYAFALTTAHSLAPEAYAFATRRLCASAPAEMVARIGRGIGKTASGSVLCEVLLCYNPALQNDKASVSSGFYIIMAAQFFSSLADNALLVAAIALLMQADAPSWLTPYLKFFFVVSYVVLAPYVGAFADRLPKGHVMFIANTVKILGCVLMLWGTDPLLAYAVVGLGAAAYSPAKYGILTEYLPHRKLVVANGWIEGLTVASIILGTVFGGVLIHSRVSGVLLHFDFPMIDTPIDTPAEAAISVIVMGIAVIVMIFVHQVWAAIVIMILIGAMAGFFVVPMNALLQHRGHHLVGAGRSIAVQNFNENTSILVMIAPYSLLLGVGYSIYTVILVYGLFVSATMGMVLLWYQRNHRVHREEVDRLLAFARAEDPHPER